MEAFETFKTLEALTERSISSLEWVLSPKWILCLLISRHSSLVIDSSLVLITQCLIRIIDLGELFLCLGGLVHIWMVLFGELKVALFDVRLGCSSLQTQYIVVVITLSATTATTSPAIAILPCKLSPTGRHEFQLSLLPSARGRACPNRTSTPVVEHEETTSW